MKFLTKDVGDNKVWIKIQSTTDTDSNDIINVRNWIEDNCKDFCRGPIAMRYSGEYIFDTFIISQEYFVAFKLLWMSKNGSK